MKMQIPINPKFRRSKPERNSLISWKGESRFKKCYRLKNWVQTKKVKPIN